MNTAQFFLKLNEKKHGSISNAINYFDDECQLISLFFWQLKNAPINLIIKKILF